MAEKKRYTVILRGDIRVEVESEIDLVNDMISLFTPIPDPTAFMGMNYCFRADDIVAVLESSAITTPVYESVQQTEETEWEQSERMRKAGVEV